MPDPWQRFPWARRSAHLWVRGHTGLVLWPAPFEFHNFSLGCLFELLFSPVLWQAGFEHKLSHPLLFWAAALCAHFCWLTQPAVSGARYLSIGSRPNRHPKEFADLRPGFYGVRQESVVDQVQQICYFYRHQHTRSSPCSKSSKAPALFMRHQTRRVPLYLLSAFLLL